jgi:hypothetical protein
MVIYRNGHLTKSSFDRNGHLTETSFDRNGLLKKLLNHGAWRRRKYYFNQHHYKTQTGIVEDVITTKFLRRRRHAPWVRNFSYPLRLAARRRGNF